MISVKLTDMTIMTGMTISEMAKKLGIGIKTIEGRIQRGGYKPLTKDAVYSMDVFEAIKEVPGKGRPPKEKPEAPPKPRQASAKAKTPKPKKN
jgi:DNA-binding XRE family transcriptional regulator